MQVPESTPDPLFGFQATEDEVEEALVFAGPTAVGGLFESAHDVHAATYFSGYLAKWLSKRHLQMKKATLYECEKCCKILCETADLEMHSFTFFKDYKQSFDNTGYLQYCSSYFVDCVVEYERIFLYFFSKYSHYHSFSNSLLTFTLSYGRKPDLCCDELLHKLIRHFFKCRIFQSVKRFNRTLQKSKHVGDKILKITHQ